MMAAATSVLGNLGGKALKFLGKKISGAIHSPKHGGVSGALRNVGNTARDVMNSAPVKNRADQLFANIGSFVDKKISGAIPIVGDIRVGEQMREYMSQKYNAISNGVLGETMVDNVSNKVGQMVQRADPFNKTSKASMGFALGQTVRNLTAGGTNNSMTNLNAA